jgi:hypothetical protein
VWFFLLIGQAGEFCASWRRRMDVGSKDHG